MPLVKKSSLPKFDPARPHVLIQKHKHGPFLYTIRDEAQLYRTALKLAQENLTYGCYEVYEEDEGRAQDMRNAITSNDGAKVWTLMEWRSDEGYEHEGVELTRPGSI